MSDTAPGLEPGSRMKKLAKGWAGMLVIGLALILVIGGFLASTGLFNVDEVITYAGANAFRGSGTFVVWNGFDAFQFASLRLGILVDGPRGLVPQYPVGTAIVGAPLLALFGIRGLIFLNVLAAVATLFVTRALAKRLFDDELVAVLAVLLLFAGTFWLEYAFAIWPHAVSVLCVTLSLLFALRAFEEGECFARNTFLSGLAVGIGFLFRSDTILVLPVIGIWALLFCGKPFRMGLWGALGLVPGVALAAWANWVKFGTLNPLSYGQPDGGGTDLMRHVMPIVGLVLVFALLLVVRYVRWRPKPQNAVIALVVLSALALLVIPPARDLAIRYLDGFWKLVVDATALGDSRLGVQAGPGGMVSFWGHWKKALGQSMPWLGIVAFLAFARWPSRHPYPAAFVLTLVALWTLPFCLLAWHGGMSSNMRYFLPVLPALCALCAKLMVVLARSIEHPQRLLAGGAVLAIILVAIWTAMHPAGFAGAHQILSTYVLALTVVLALLAGLHGLPGRIARQATLAAIGCGLVMAAMFTISDLVLAQKRRALAASNSAALSALPDRSLFIGHPKFVIGWAFRPNRMVSMADAWTGEADIPLIEAALAKEYRVFVWPGGAVEKLHDRFGLAIKDSEFRFSGGKLLEIELEHVSENRRPSKK